VIIAIVQCEKQTTSHFHDTGGGSCFGGAVYNAPFFAGSAIKLLNQQAHKTHQMWLKSTIFFP